MKFLYAFLLPPLVLSTATVTKEDRELSTCPDCWPGTSGLCKDYKTNVCRGYWYGTTCHTGYTLCGGTYGGSPAEPVCTNTVGYHATDGPENVDQGCKPEEPVCVGDGANQQLPASVNGAKCAACLNTLESDNAGDPDDGCNGSYPLCVNDYDQNPGIWKAGLDCIAKCTNSGDGDFPDWGCTKTHPNCAEYDGLAITSDGTSGSLCETKPDDCAENKCQNGGICVDGIESYTCDCSGTDFYGEFCEFSASKPDDCAENKCQNSGVCVEGIESYTCDCSGTDFYGEFCEYTTFKCVNTDPKKGGLDFGCTDPDLPKCVITNHNDEPALGHGGNKCYTATPFEIDLDLNNVDQKYQSAFPAAVARWESIIYGNGGLEIDDGPHSVTTKFEASDPCVSPSTFNLFICAEIGPIDEGGNSVDGNTLGFAGPRFIRKLDRWIPFAGAMVFDEYDVQQMINDGRMYEDVILHEMGHVLGLGTLWNYNNLATPDSPTCQYTGAKANQEWQKLTGCPETSTLPLEPGVCGHWDEACLDTELVTPIVERPGTGMPISQLTVASLDDLGYIVDYDFADEFTPDQVRPSCSCNARVRSLSGNKRRKLSDEGKNKAIADGLAFLEKRDNSDKNNALLQKDNVALADVVTVFFKEGEDFFSVTVNKNNM